MIIPDTTYQMYQVELGASWAVKRKGMAEQDFAGYCMKSYDSFWHLILTSE